MMDLLYHYTNSPLSAPVMNVWFSPSFTVVFLETLDPHSPDRWFRKFLNMKNEFRLQECLLLRADTVS